MGNICLISNGGISRPSWRWQDGKGKPGLRRAFRVGADDFLFSVGYDIIKKIK